VYYITLLYYDTDKECGLTEPSKSLRPRVIQIFASSRVMLLGRRSLPIMSSAFLPHSSLTAARPPAPARQLKKLHTSERIFIP